MSKAPAKYLKIVLRGKARKRYFAVWLPPNFLSETSLTSEIPAPQAATWTKAVSVDANRRNISKAS
jgi:hypothetical protein